MFLLVGTTRIAYSQNQSDLIDLRDCGKSCTSENYDIETVFLSDIDGNPITNSLRSCTPGEEQITYITFTYSSNSNSDIHNARLFADLIVGDEEYFLNYYFGTIQTSTSSVNQLTLTEFPLNWTCGEEVILMDPLLAWTTSGDADLSESYVCNSYPGGQCQKQQTIVVEAPLAVQFEYAASCPEDGVSSVQFFSTTNGGKEPYSYTWAFTNAETDSSYIADPVVGFFESGRATLIVTDDNGTVNSYEMDIVVQEEITFTSTVINQTDQENPDGAIELEMTSTGTYTFSWEGPEGFTSTQKDIYGLQEGIYTVTISDGECPVIHSFEVSYITPLPILWGKIEAIPDRDKESVEIHWSTAKEWESSHFEIERAVNSLDNFEIVGEVPSQGWGDEIIFYTFKDENLPHSGGRLYYRIKEVSLDGETMVSKTLRVDIPSRNELQNWAVFPNPYEGEKLHLKYLGYPKLAEEMIYIRIFSPNSIHNNYLTTEEDMVDLSDVIKFFPKGLLIIEIKYQDKIETLKVIKN